MGVFPMMVSGAIISTGTDAPTEYLSDAFSASEGSSYLVRSDRDPVGQSFTHTTAGGEAWRLRSITFRSNDATGTTNETTVGLSINIYSGQSVGAGDLLGTFTFSNDTFDATPDNYMRFALTDGESATVGDLTSGALYTVALRVTGDTALRIDRSSGDVYAGGQGMWNSSFQSNSDSAFWVEAVPEPATLGLIVCFGGGVLILRRLVHL
ncbi:hypothetical protein P4C99_17585 [Pontiellaceae bacterium B1224]|nr:hypothetical protein [Pontiellaceae bacterium B1224]